MLTVDAAILLAASLVAGMVNAIAGGGSLITFPVLVWLGREPILANATNTVSLWPGSLAALIGFRRELAGGGPWLAWGAAPSIAGGLLGALLLLVTPSPVFASLVPWLIFFATVLFAASGPLTRLLRRKAAATHGDPPPSSPTFLAYQLAVATYGGYFGAGIGIMMLAGLALSGFTDIHRMIAFRNFYAILINGVAAAYFVARGAVAWTDAAVLTVGQVAGGFLGSWLARALSPERVRWVVVAVGLSMGAALLLRR
jgi:uncharacterized membrane protein YfcA